MRTTHRKILIIVVSLVFISIKIGCNNFTNILHSGIINSKNEDEAVRYVRYFYKGNRFNPTYRSANDFMNRLSSIEIHGKVIETTCLHLAIALRYRRLVELLISYGININIQDSDGNTPMHLAIYERDCSVIIMLANTKRVDVFIRNHLGASVRSIVCNIIFYLRHKELLQYENLLNFIYSSFNE